MGSYNSLFLLIIGLIIIIVIIFVVILIASDLTSIRNTADRTIEKVDQLTDHVASIVSPIEDLTQQDAIDFGIQYSLSYCAFNVGVCDIIENPNSYNPSRCLPGCEYIINIKHLCEEDKKLANNEICQIVQNINT